VMVHGLPGSGYDWAPLTEALVARGHEVIAYDRVGYGRSDPRPEGQPFTPGANARELVELLERQDLRDVSVVGWSYGGPISIEAALLDGSRIARLVLLGTGGPSDEMSEPPDPPGAVAGAILRWVGAVPPAAAALRRTASEVAFSGQPLPDWWLPLVGANFDAPHTRQTWVAETTGLGSLEGEFRVGDVAMPILLLHGDDDRLAPLGASRWIEARAVDAELVVVPGASHMLPITHSDLVAEQIAAFARGDASP